MLKMFTTFSTIFNVLVLLAKCFCVSCGNSLFSIVFQFLQSLWVVQINSFFDKSSQKEVWRGTVSDRRGQGPSHAVTRELLL
jgi:hypothetical protein